MATTSLDGDMAVSGTGPPPAATAAPLAAASFRLTEGASLQLPDGCRVTVRDGALQLPDGQRFPLPDAGGHVTIERRLRRLDGTTALVRHTVRLGRSTAPRSNAAAPGPAEAAPKPSEAAPGHVEDAPEPGEETPGPVEAASVAGEAAPGSGQAVLGLSEAVPGRCDTAPGLTEEVREPIKVSPKPSAAPPGHRAAARELTEMTSGFSDVIPRFIEETSRSSGEDLKSKTTLPELSVIVPDSTGTAPVFTRELPTPGKTTPAVQEHPSEPRGSAFGGRTEKNSDGLAENINVAMGQYSADDGEIIPRDTISQNVDDNNGDSDTEDMLDIKAESKAESRLSSMDNESTSSEDTVIAVMTVGATPNACDYQSSRQESYDKHEINQIPDSTIEDTALTSNGKTSHPECEKSIHDQKTVFHYKKSDTFKVYEDTADNTDSNSAISDNVSNTSTECTFSSPEESPTIHKEDSGIVLDEAMSPEYCPQHGGDATKLNVKPTEDKCIDTSEYQCSDVKNKPTTAKYKNVIKCDKSNINQDSEDEECLDSLPELVQASLRESSSNTHEAQLEAIENREHHDHRNCGVNCSFLVQAGNGLVDTIANHKIDAVHKLHNKQLIHQDSLFLPRYESRRQISKRKRFSPTKPVEKPFVFCPGVRSQKPKTTNDQKTETKTQNSSFAGNETQHPLSSILKSLQSRNEYKELPEQDQKLECSDELAEPQNLEEIEHVSVTKAVSYFEAMSPRHVVRPTPKRRFKCGDNSLKNSHESQPCPRTADAEIKPPTSKCKHDDFEPVKPSPRKVSFATPEENILPDDQGLIDAEGACFTYQPRYIQNETTEYPKLIFKEHDLGIQTKNMKLDRTETFEKCVENGSTELHRTASTYKKDTLKTTHKACQEEYPLSTTPIIIPAHYVNQAAASEQDVKHAPENEHAENCQTKSTCLTSAQDEPANRSAEVVAVTGYHETSDKPSSLDVDIIDNARSLTAKMIHEPDRLIAFVEEDVSGTRNDSEDDVDQSATPPPQKSEHAEQELSVGDSLLAHDTPRPDERKSSTWFADCVELCCCCWVP